MYLGGSKPESRADELIPTKAALFGLDIRFREVDARLKAEDDERNALKRRCKSGGGAGRSNRHNMPFNKNLLSRPGEKRPILSHLIKETTQSARMKISKQGPGSILFMKTKPEDLPSFDPKMTEKMREHQASPEVEDLSTEGRSPSAQTARPQTTGRMSNFGTNHSFAQAESRNDKEKKCSTVQNATTFRDFSYNQKRFLDANTVNSVTAKDLGYHPPATTLPDGSAAPMKSFKHQNVNVRLNSCYEDLIHKNLN